MTVVQRTAPAGSRRVRRAATTVLMYALVAVAVWLVWPSALGGCTSITLVSGRSMEPTYHTGDVVVGRCGTPVVGDVVVYQPVELGGARIIHRVVGGGPDGWVVRGDNNDVADPYVPTDDQVEGVAVLHLPKIGILATQPVSPLVWISLVALGGALLVWPSRSAPAVPSPSDPGAAPEPSVADGSDVAVVAAPRAVDTPTTGTSAVGPDPRPVP